MSASLSTLNDMDGMDMSLTIQSVWGKIVHFPSLSDSLDFLSEEIATAAEMIMDLMDEIKEVRIQNAEKDERITLIECRMADLEQMTSHYCHYWVRYHAICRRRKQNVQHVCQQATD